MQGLSAGGPQPCQIRGPFDPLPQRFGQGAEALLQQTAEQFPRFQQRPFNSTFNSTFHSTFHSPFGHAFFEQRFRNRVCAMTCTS